MAVCWTHKDIVNYLERESLWERERDSVCVCVYVCVHVCTYVCLLITSLLICFYTQRAFSELGWYKSSTFERYHLLFSSIIII